MELVSHKIPAGSRQSDTILVMPVGDIQWFGDPKGIALKMLKRHIQWGVDNGAYFLGMGDYIDTFSPSNRQRLSNANLYDTGLQGIDKMARDLVREIYEEALKPSKGRWLGLLEGHHFHEYRNNTTTDQDLADLLDAPFLGTSAYVRLVFSRAGRGTYPVTIWAHHGVGSGTSANAALNKLQAISKGFEADIYVMGHFTSIDGKPMDRIEPYYPTRGNKPPRLIHRTKLLVASGGFMKGYQVGSKDGNIPRGNYVEKGMMNPAHLGGPLIKVTPRWKQDTDGAKLWLPDLRVEL